MDLFQAFADRLAATTTIGVTAAETDVYFLIDELIDRTKAELPPFACRSGCNLCCYSPPLVTSLEWRALYPALLATPLPVQQSILAMAETLRPLAKELATVRQTVLDHQSKTDPPLRVQCPLLVEGRCSVYAARPLFCRAYGYFLHGQSGDQFFGTDLALRKIMTTFPRRAALPTLEPYVQRVNDLNEAIPEESTAAFLPQWLWAHIRDGAFVETLNPRPSW